MDRAGAPGGQNINLIHIKYLYLVVVGLFGLFLDLSGLVFDCCGSFWAVVSLSGLFSIFLAYFWAVAVLHFVFLAIVVVVVVFFLVVVAPL